MRALMRVHTDDHCRHARPLPVSLKVTVAGMPYFGSVSVAPFSSHTTARPDRPAPR
jgi:hypothetical protein